MEQIDVFKAKIVRNHVNLDWGFRLEGGAEHALPIKVHRVTPGSPAHSIGISSNDVITEIGDVPTNRLTFQQVHDLIAQYGDTIVLTIERKARGSVPQKPVVSHPHHDQPKSYQTYDMSGAKAPAPQYNQPTQLGYQSAQPHRTQHPQQDNTKFYQTYDLNGPNMHHRPQQTSHQPQYNPSDFPTAMSRPFEAAPRGYVPPAAPQAPSPQRDPYPAPEPYSPGHSSYSPKYVPEEEKVGDGVSQSKTFKILQSLMQNDEPYSGVGGLPPPRSLEQDRWKEDYARQHPGARVRVFMPQKYNCPMDLYSAPNVVNSFTQQASGYFDGLESSDQEIATAGGVAKSQQFKPESNAPSSHNPYNYMSQTAAAVLEDDYRRQSKKMYWPEYATMPRHRTGRRRPVAPPHQQAATAAATVSYENQLEEQPAGYKPVPFKPIPQSSVQMVLQQHQPVSVGYEPVSSLDGAFKVPQHVLVPSRPKQSQHEIVHQQATIAHVAVKQMPVPAPENPVSQDAKQVSEAAKSEVGEAKPAKEVLKPKTAELPKPNAEVPKPTGDVKEQTTKVSKQTEEVPKLSKEAVKLVENVSKPTEKVQKSLEEKPIEAVSKATEEVPKSSEEGTKPVENVLKAGEEVLTSSEDVPNPAEDVSKQESVVQSEESKSEPITESVVSVERTPAAASEPPKDEVKNMETIEEQSTEEEIAVKDEATENKEEPKAEKEEPQEEEHSIEFSLVENDPGEGADENIETEFTFTIQTSETTDKVADNRKESDDSGVSVSSTARPGYGDTAGMTNF